MECCGVLGGSSFDAGEADAFFEIKQECQEDVPKTRFRPKVGSTLSARKWHSAFSPEEGRLDIAKVLRRIQHGGIHPSIKGVVWEFLLGCYDPMSTFDERSQLRQRRRQQYGLSKSECQEMEATVGSGRIITAPIITEDGYPIQDPSGNGGDGLQEKMWDGFEENMPSIPVDKKIIQWKLTLHQIGLDVVRTDRTLVFYENEGNQAKLWDILAVYAWIDKDIGYCQGMSDLCSPMVILLGNEADAFWCFEHLMRRLRGNFKCTTSSVGVQSQLSTLASIIKTVDPKLHQHLEDLDGGEYLFAFRMLMVLFRRGVLICGCIIPLGVDVGYGIQPKYLLVVRGVGFCYGEWLEVKGNDKPLKQYGKFERENVRVGSKDQQNALSIFLVASVLEGKNKRLLKEAKGLDDVVKMLNEITGNLDAKKACIEALKLHKKYLTKTMKA